MKSLLLSWFFFASFSYAISIEELASSLKLYPGTKAVIQWERVFSNEQRMARYNIDTLSLEIRIELKKYLISHAADSEQPIVPGL